MQVPALFCTQSHGIKYSPATIRSILSGLNRISKESKDPFNIFDKQNPCFCKLHLTFSCVTSTLHREGIGVIKNSAAVILFEDEELFWTSEVFGYHSPKALQRAVFYSVGLLLCYEESKSNTIATYSN